MEQSSEQQNLEPSSIFISSIQTKTRAVLIGVLIVIVLLCIVSLIVWRYTYIATTPQTGQQGFVWMPLAIEAITSTAEYRQNDSGVYWNRNEQPVISSDVAGFQVAAWQDSSGVTYLSFAKDSAHVFSREKVLKDADPNTFIVFSHYCYKDLLYLCEYYEKDKNHVYDNLGNLIDYADPNTFTPVLTSVGLPTGYAVDKNHTFYRSSVTQVDGDPTTFELIDDKGNFAKDSTHVYVYGRSRTGGASGVSFDVRSFTTLSYPGGVSDSFVKDKNYVYYCGFDDNDFIGALAGVDPASFVVLMQYGDGSQADTYAKDKNHVYWNVTEIPNADAPTFVVVEKAQSDGVIFDAQDKNHRYYRGQIAL
jgi:hypothetical protein